MTITIDEAIELLSAYIYEDKSIPVQDFDDATKLGIEALKKVKGVREGKEWVGINLLPGETEK